MVTLRGNSRFFNVSRLILKMFFFWVGGNSHPFPHPPVYPRQLSISLYAQQDFRCFGHPSSRHAHYPSPRWSCDGVDCIVIFMAVPEKARQNTKQYRFQGHASSYDTAISTLKVRWHRQTVHIPTRCLNIYSGTLFRVTKLRAVEVLCFWWWIRISARKLRPYYTPYLTIHQRWFFFPIF